MSGSVLFWDASALVPLMVEEDRSSLAREIWSEASESHAWDWILVEVDAALIRRRADQDMWQDWRNVQAGLRLYALQSGDIRNLRLLNRSIGLRAADAGHLFLFHTLVQRYFDFELITFDREMAAAGRRLGLPLHPACTQS